MINKNMAVQSIQYKKNKKHVIRSENNTFCTVECIILIALSGKGGGEQEGYLAQYLRR